MLLVDLPDRRQLCVTTGCRHLLHVVVRRAHFFELPAAGSFALSVEIGRPGLLCFMSGHHGWRGGVLGVGVDDGQCVARWAVVSSTK